jgi:hypothetical protein
LPGAAHYGATGAAGRATAITTTVDADKVGDLRLFVELPGSALPRSVPAPMDIVVEDAEANASTRTQTVFQAPENSK